MQVDKTLISERRLQARVRRLAEMIAADFTGDELVVVGLMCGSFMFVADLIRRLHTCHLPLIVDFMVASSYGARQRSSGRVSLRQDLSVAVRGRCVLLVDDIMDTGRTLHCVETILRRRRPAILKTCVLLDKPCRRVVGRTPDYVGFTIPDQFVAGYGLDAAGRHREQPFLSAPE